jgi:Flp pilus assembly protein TadD
MGWREITADPVAWLKLLGRKLLILTNIREVGNNRPLTLARESSPMISLLFLISLGLLIPLALPGAIALRCNPVAKATLLYSVVYAASVMLFFINMRYRMPLVPPAAIFTGASFVVVIRQIKERRLKLMALIAIPAAFLLTFPPWVGHDFDPPAQVQFVSGNAYLRLNRPAEAIDAYDRAVQLDSTYPDLHLNRGAALMMLGDSISAASEFHTELHQNEKNPRAWNNLGVILESRGDLDSALVCYDNSLASAPYMTDARRNATRLELRRADDLFKSGLLSDAELHIRRAAELSPADPAPVFRLALLAGARGDISQAKFLLQRTLTLDPNYPPARVLLDRLESP